MQQPSITLKFRFNEDDELIARIDECERIKAVCENKNCPFRTMITARISELKHSLADNHMMP